MAVCGQRGSLLSAPFFWRAIQNCLNPLQAEETFNNRPAELMGALEFGPSMAAAAAAISLFQRLSIFKRKIFQAGNS
jgi:hypothetical protein